MNAGERNGPTGSEVLELSSEQSSSDTFAIICAGVALVADGYQNNLMTMMNEAYGHDRYCYTNYTWAVSNSIIAASFMGEIVGRAIIEYAVDYFGMDLAILSTTLMILFGGILEIAAHGLPTEYIFSIIRIIRFIVGMGIGGEYPVSSMIVLEAANKYKPRNPRAFFILIANFLLLLGGLLAVSVFLADLSSTNFETMCADARLWNLSAGRIHLLWNIGLGCIPLLAFFLLPKRMPNQRAYGRGATKKWIPYKRIISYHWRSLIVTSASWFICDLISFPNGIFSTIDPSRDKFQYTTTHYLKEEANWRLNSGILALLGLVIGVCLCKCLGRRYTMMLGFAGLFALGLFLSNAPDEFYIISPLSVSVVKSLYLSLRSSGNMGPGNMASLLSSQIYAPSVRATCFRFSAFVGKVGAAMAALVLESTYDYNRDEDLQDHYKFIIDAICGALGVFITYYFIEDLTERDISSRHEMFEAYLEEYEQKREMDEGKLEEDIDGGKLE